MRRIVITKNKSVQEKFRLDLKEKFPETIVEKLAYEIHRYYANKAVS